VGTVLQELHWLPVRRRVNFKLTTLMFKSLHGCAPSYLSDACKSAPEASRHLRSSDSITCVIPWSRTRRTAALEQAACFTAVIWQSLPIQKTVENVFVCQGLGCGALWLLLLDVGYKYSYLLTLLTYNLLNWLLFQKIACLHFDVNIQDGRYPPSWILGVNNGFVEKPTWDFL